MRKTNLPDLRQHYSASTPPVVMDKARFAQTRGNAQLAADTTYRKIDGKWTKVLDLGPIPEFCVICGKFH